MAQQQQQQGMAPQKAICKGTCKKFDPSKGFGFITVDDGSGDVFVHYTEIQAQGFKSLAEGESVEFEIVTQSDGRRKAVNVTGPNGANVQGQKRNNFGGGQQGNYNNFNNMGNNRGFGGGYNPNNNNYNNYGGGQRGGYNKGFGGRGGAPPQQIPQFGGFNNNNYQNPQQPPQQFGAYNQPQTNMNNMNNMGQQQQFGGYN